MNRLIAYSTLLTAFFLNGCVTRTIPYEVDRVDQEIKGNRGVVVGTPPPVEETGIKKTRTMYNIEIELPSLYRQMPKEKDKDLYGNRGYIQGQVSPEREEYIPKSEGGITRLGGFRDSQMPEVVYSEPVKKEGVAENEGYISQKEAGFYLVEKGDTLQKISSKMYGTTKKWKKIYEANKDVLKSPDTIRPGQKLVIPKE